MTWTAADGKLLKDLRTAAGLDRATLARRCTISTSQLTELEEGGNGRFYSESIKAHTGRTVLAKLGHVKAVEAPAAQEAPVAGAAAAPETIQAPSTTWAASAGARPEATKDLWNSVQEPEPDTEPQPETEPAKASTSTHSPQPAAVTSAKGADGHTWPWIAGLVAIAAAVGVGLWMRGSGAPAPTAAAPAPAATAADTQPNSAPAEVAAAATTSAPAAAPDAAIPSAPEQTGAATPERAASLVATGACSLPASATPVTFMPARALKSSSYVYLEASEAIPVCVVDARQRRTATAVTPAEGVTLSGTPPFTVHTPRWAALRVYFQGVRVPLDDPGLQGGSLLLQPAS